MDDHPHAPDIHNRHESVEQVIGGILSNAHCPEEKSARYRESEGPGKQGVYITKSQDPKNLSLNEILDLIKNANSFLEEPASP